MAKPKKVKKMMKSLIKLSRRVEKLERSILANDRNWIEAKIEEFEDTLKVARQKNKKSLDNISEAFKEVGVESTRDVEKVVKKSERTPNEPIQKEVNRKVESLPTFKSKVDYLSDVWENRFRSSLKNKRSSRVIDPEYIVGVAVVKGLILAVKSSIGSFWLFSIASHILTALLVGMVLVLIFVDLKAFQRIRDFISNKISLSTARTAVAKGDLPPIAILD